MTTVHITTGLPASGKTELARSLWPALRFNMDDMRAQLGMTHERWNKKIEGVVFKAMLAAAKVAVEAGCDIVLDNTHMTPSWPRTYRKELGSLGVDFVVYDLTGVSVDVCIARDALRVNGVGEEVIRRLAERHAEARKGGWRLTEQWMNGERYAEPEPYAHTDGLPWVVLCDIDGTLAHHEGNRSPYDYSKVMGDQPNLPVKWLVEVIGAEHDVIFMSGRDALCRADTEQWLTDKLGFCSPIVYMRADDDKRPDNVVKAELFDTNIRGRYNVRFVLDDRDRVVKMWREMGLTCLQVAPGNF